MSLYNMLMQMNPGFGLLCAIVGIGKDNAQDMGRVRDAWISEDAKTIGILHRNYGDDGQEANDTAATLPAFRELQSCDDDTYAVWLFDVPDVAEEVAKQIAKQTDNMPCWDRYKQAIDDMTSGKETPQTEHMKEVGEQIIGGIAKSFEDGKSRSVDTQDGSVDIITPGGEE